jgi:amidohydrolase
MEDRIDEIFPELCTLSLNIHSHPEQSFQEHYACGELTEFLKNHGFELTGNLGGLDTAFLAEKKGRGPGPAVALTAEYDALPIGHACGHNLIAAASMGAAAGLLAMMGEIQGTLKVIGTPAEEGGGGKVILCDKGVFRDVDFAMQVHPHKMNMIQCGSLAVRTVNVEFYGRMAHSSRPEEGVNALSSVLHTFSAIDAQRALLPNKTNISGIVTEGGKANNVIPDYASASFCVRASTVYDMQAAQKAARRAVESSDLLFGTTSRITCGILYSERYPNRPMDEAYKAHLESFGELVTYPPVHMKLASSDVGNVSLEVPMIQPYLYIGDADVHTKEFEKAAAAPFAQEQMKKAAKALARTAYDLFVSDELRQKAIRDFKEKVPRYTRAELGYGE